MGEHDNEAETEEHDVEVYRNRYVSLPAEAARHLEETAADHVLFLAAQHRSDDDDKVSILVYTANDDDFVVPSDHCDDVLRVWLGELDGGYRAYLGPWFGWQSLQYRHLPDSTERTSSFEAFCSEQGHLDAWGGDNYRPIAFVSRRAPTRVHWVDEVVRPWLDLACQSRCHARYCPLARQLLSQRCPFAVLSDYWRERADPRGAWLDALTKGPRTPEQWTSLLSDWVASRGRWLGELGGFVPRSGIALGPRFLEQLSLYVPPGSHAPMDHPVLRAARRLHFLAGSHGFVSEAVRHAEAIGPLPIDAVLAAERLSGPMAARVLAVQDVTLDDLPPIDWSRWPRLERLEVAARGEPPGLLTVLDEQLPAGVELDVAPVHADPRSELGSMGRTRAAATFVETAEAWLDHPAARRRPVAIWQSDPTTHRPNGWAVRREGSGVRARQTSLSGSADHHVLERLHAQWADVRVSLWTPEQHLRAA